METVDALKQLIRAKEAEREMLAREVSALREALRLVERSNDRSVDPTSRLLTTQSRPKLSMQGELEISGEPKNHERICMILEKNGSPMRVVEISREFAKATGRPDNAGLKATITSAISKKVHSGILFRKVSPGVYGLIGRD